MRILIANVNTTAAITEAIAEQARSVAAPGTEIVGLTPWFGAESVEGNFESYLAAIGVMDRVLAYDQPFDAVIQAGYGEHGREGLQELLEVPVVDITDAAASTAMYLGHAYSVVTTLDRTVPLIEDRLKLSGLYERCASVRASGLAVLELEADPRRAVEAIVEQAERAVREDKAEVICLGCGGMAGLDEQIRQRTGVPVVDGVSAAVTIAESLVRMGLSTSKVRTYATPRVKKVVGWPAIGSVSSAQQPSQPLATATRQGEPQRAMSQVQPQVAIPCGLDDRHPGRRRRPHARPLHRLPVISGLRQCLARQPAHAREPAGVHRLVITDDVHHRRHPQLILQPGIDNLAFIVGDAHLGRPVRGTDRRGQAVALQWVDRQVQAWQGQADATVPGAEHQALHLQPFTAQLQRDHTLVARYQPGHRPPQQQPALP